MQVTRSFLRSIGTHDEPGSAFASNMPRDAERGEASAIHGPIADRGMSSGDRHRAARRARPTTGTRLKARRVSTSGRDTPSKVALSEDGQGRRLQRPADARLRHRRQRARANGRSAISPAASAGPPPALTPMRRRSSGTLASFHPPRRAGCRRVVMIIRVSPAAPPDGGDVDLLMSSPRRRASPRAILQRVSDTRKIRQWRPQRSHQPHELPGRRCRRSRPSSGPSFLVPVAT